MAFSSTPIAFWLRRICSAAGRSFSGSVVNDHGTGASGVPAALRVFCAAGQFTLSRYSWSRLLVLPLRGTHELRELRAAAAQREALRHRLVERDDEPLRRLRVDLGGVRGLERDDLRRFLRERDAARDEHDGGEAVSHGRA
jgi:hypothetical protein